MKRTLNSSRRHQLKKSSMPRAWSRPCSKIWSLMRGRLSRKSRTGMACQTWWSHSMEATSAIIIITITITSRLLIQVVVRAKRCLTLTLIVMIIIIINLIKKRWWEIWGQTSANCILLWNLRWLSLHLRTRRPQQVPFPTFPAPRKLLLRWTHRKMPSTKRQQCS